LRLNGTQVKDGSVEALQNLSSLTSLSLAECKELDGSGLGVLAALPKLHTLILSGTKTNDETIESVLQLTQLESLSLERTSVSDGGLKKLAVMKGLREVYLAKSQCTTAGVGALKNMLPDCRISMDELKVTEVPPPQSDDKPSPTRYDRVRDVQYGTKHGMALLLDIIKPSERTNGKGIVWIIGDSYYSRREMIEPTIPLMDALLSRGYTIFAVTHGSSPLFNVEECVEDVHRAVRFIRQHAGDYKIDPESLGSIGYSGAGHLAMMLGSGDGHQWKFHDQIAIEGAFTEDPIDSLSGRVQCVVSFYGPADFIHYGEDGTILDHRASQNYRGPFLPKVWNVDTRTYNIVVEPSKVSQWLAMVSPISHVSADSAPVYMIHGDMDPNVPVQQSYVMRDALQNAGVHCRLVVKPEAGHGWSHEQTEMTDASAWFDEHLK
jgi:acetyl esterase/lipase